MIRYFSFILLLFSGIGFIGQGTMVMDSSGQVILSTSDDRLRDSSGKVLYTLRGNLIFKGDSYRNEDLLYLVRNRDVLGNSAGYIFNFDMSATLYSFKKGSFFIGEDRLEDRQVMKFEKTDHLVLVRDGNGVLIGTVSGDQSTSDLLLAFLGLAGHYQVKENFNGLNDSTLNGLGRGIRGIIQPAWSQHYYYQWQWDGRILKPSWGNRPEDEWIFDGTYLKPFWRMGSGEEWIWDGQYLKPLYEHVPELTFIWDNNSIRPFWDYRLDS